MGQWLAEHISVFGDIALLWVAPVLLVAILARLLRLPHRGLDAAQLPAPTPLVVRADQNFDERSAA